MNRIYHIVTTEDWQKGRSAGFYLADSLDTDGFIHCSTAAQLIGVANDFYAGQDGLVLLVVDEERISAEVRYEDCYESGQKFPHIYGPLPLSAVVEDVDFPHGEDGKFTFPDNIAL